jgi:hypothetical protein
MATARALAEANKMAALDEYAAQCKPKLPPGKVFFSQG